MGDTDHNPIHWHHRRRPQTSLGGRGRARFWDRLGLAWMAVWAAVASMALTGCRGTSDESIVVDQPASAGDVDAPAGFSSGSATASRVVLHDSQLSAGDARREGWLTEDFSERANRQLQKLSDAFAKQVWTSLPADLIADSFRSSDLFPDDRKTVFQDGQTVVERYDGSSGRAERVERDATAALTRLANAFTSYENRNAKFKLFQVATDDGQMTTRQYCHLSGNTETHVGELNAVWRMGWEAADELELPRIAWIQLERLERVTSISSAPHRPWFVDRTTEVLGHESSYWQALAVGIDHWLTHLDASLGVYTFGYHGLSVGDVNGDGLDDLYVCQTGGIPNHLYIQQTDGTLRDVSSAAQVDYLDNTRSALLIDLDNDGDQDIVLALNSGLLFLENDGNGRFQPRARISSVRQAFSLAAADYDNDGLLDLYVCVYYGAGDLATELPLPLPYFDARNGGSNFLIRNQGNWKFEDVTTQVGLDDDNRRFSFAAAWEDHDSDGDLDLLVVNDFGPNHLYQQEDGTFRNVALENGLVDGGFGMSAAWGDYDRDGVFDVYVANMFSAAGNRITFQPQFKPEHSDATRARFRHLARGNSLFHGLGEGQYEDVSVAMNVTMGRWSWASLFADMNNDGWEDLLVTNGYITGTQTDDL